jgi:hypothetical protein
VVVVSQHNYHYMSTTEAQGIDCWELGTMAGSLQHSEQDSIRSHLAILTNDEAFKSPFESVDQLFEEVMRRSVDRKIVWHALCDANMRDFANAVLGIEGVAPTHSQLPATYPKGEMRKTYSPITTAQVSRLIECIKQRSPSAWRLIQHYLLQLLAGTDVVHRLSPSMVSDVTTFFNIIQNAQVDRFVLNEAMIQAGHRWLVSEIEKL